MSQRKALPSSIQCITFLFLVMFAGFVCLALANESEQPDAMRTRRCDVCVENAIIMNRTIAGTTQALNNVTDAANIAIDWREVGENFHKVLSEDEVFHKWDTMEANMRSGIRALLRNIFPKVVAMSSDAKVSGNCSAGLLKWIVSLRHMKTWALKMLDATGKPPSGMFEGVVSMFGNYDQCLKIRVFHDDEESEGTGDIMYHEPQEEPKEFFRGQYCVAEFKPWLPKKPPFYGMNTVLKSPFHEKNSVFAEFAKMSVFFHFISLRMDLCVPSTCSKDDIQRVADLMAHVAEFRALVLRCEIDDGQTVWTFKLFIVSAVIALFVALSCIATMHDLKFVRSNWLIIKWLTAVFSAKNSWRLFHKSVHFDSSNLNPLYGVRVLILLWIVAVHTFIVVDFQYFREMQTLKSWATKWPTQIFTNSLFQFDCLILITAFTFGYANIGSQSRQVGKYLLKHYLKMSILLLVMIFIGLSLPFVITRGPLTQDFIAKYTRSCQINGWSNLLLVQNYFHSDCLPSTWIFCVEFQLMILMTPLLVFYHKFGDYSLARNIFWFALPLLVMLGFVYNFVQVFTNRLPPTYYWTLPDKEQRNEYFQYYYYKPWAHLSVFVIGFYAGVHRKLSNSDPKPPHADQSISYLVNILSMSVILTFTFGFHDWITGELPNEFISAVYNAVQNVCLALAYSWILFYLTDNTKTDNISPLARLLQASPFRQLGKLTTTGYLALPIVQTVLLSSQQQHLYSSSILMIYVMIGNAIFTYIFALALTLVVEVPASQAFAPLLNYLFKIQTQENERVRDIKSEQLESSSDCSTNIELPICKEKL